MRHWLLIVQRWLWKLPNLPLIVRRRHQLPLELPLIVRQRQQNWRWLPLIVQQLPLKMQRWLLKWQRQRQKLLVLHRIGQRWLLIVQRQHLKPLGLLLIEQQLQ